MAGVKKQEKLYTEAEITALYPKEYVLVEVVSISRHNQWKNGRLVVHSPDKAVVLKAVKRLVKSQPGTRTAFFYTGPVDVDIWIGLY